jgi:cobalt-zinc-cadmium efflux system membrane fusion protein
MKRIHGHRWFLSLFSVAAFAALATACGGGKHDVQAEEPPPPQVIERSGPGLIQAPHPERFRLATAVRHVSPATLVVTGIVTPDVSRNVPVISLASGRVLDVRVRLGDTVRKGELLMRVQSSDVSGAFSDYRKAAADETLARQQLARSRDLYAHGAIALSDFQMAQDVEAKARVDVQTTAQRLRLLGNDPNDLTPGIVNITAPVSGIITDQQVTSASGVQGLSSPNPFTISDLSHVWIICDVYENDLSLLHVGERADIHLAAYPDRVLRGRVGNIGAILDPNLRTAKARIEVKNPGFLRPGMFATATLFGRNVARAAVPASAVLHLHDRDWVYVPEGGGLFRRVEVVGGAMLPGAMQEIASGLAPGAQVVTDALALQNTVEQ